MTRLDDIAKQKTLDRSNVYGSIESLAKQTKDALDQAGRVKLPKNPVKNLILSGMGGSGLAARVIESAFFENLSVPLTRIHHYHLPSWAGKQTLVICSSYSGTTEETVSTLKQAIAKKCPTLVITTGGELKKLALKHRLPLYLIDPVQNPSGEPRMAIGYSLVGQLVLVKKAGLLNFTSEEFSDATKTMAQVLAANGRQIPQVKNPAKKLALSLHDKQVIMVAADHLTGALHVVKNQMNENAKQLSHRHDLPELNHHLMEGLKFPATNKKDVVFWLINSGLYLTRIQTRAVLTLDVVNRNGLNAFEYLATAPTRLAQVFEVIQFGALVNYYLTVLNGLDPAPIPWVDYFKKNLG
ncbi:MAG: Bifunctional phosphoglucose/phosphomannose isomerase [Candidatus Beckwithbacteria bacterium GW2011_GWB1_47_15]|uniref:Bifunctional phosphoglucose/phosphomannose isomerase n=1 Tax=Candidatus Beckwithbacteria bacterium GW2011_GWB1_47_15 TaxID=1618371 RepID=A0A0G1RUJ6_9BACT|nr:MAG: bifunctional phosphoglucose/phosphomannose isomerase, glucose/mannose-6-phosphate isomerase [Candidatus Beckwithbacteria bacterium GW2011_GWC1_49_16]KKU35127.1 MAG: Bifunctional phosphoglucose/phosphomannose isomerase [Candidatus Beckwithbacteria bacterium GW2011_GWA1_46_30]KKU60771.1 MAG: Bifunctional phosphoglucose/phosphomannose isomerase [Candidatus Beckwithbacteria bacterium GW2011_GWB1_47_15]KKU71576.1 MAG: Bifunctional phosphoglucose/phosphomannose isomerase [Candidatus Beckwithba